MPFNAGIAVLGGAFVGAAATLLIQRLRSPKVKMVRDYAVEGSDPAEILKTLEPDFIRALSGLKCPPHWVGLLMEAICIVMEVPPPATFTTNPFYSQAAQQMLEDPQFMAKLAGKTKATVKPSVRDALKLYVLPMKLTAADHMLTFSYGMSGEDKGAGKASSACWGLERLDERFLTLARWFMAAFG